MAYKVYLSMGSNLGDRKQHLQEGLQLLQAEGVQVRQLSGLYETAPVGPVEQGDFLNLAAEVETELPPLALLAVVQKVEAACGRTREIHWGPRTLDIDILFYDKEVMITEKLTIPHKEMTKRAFVLVPLAEIAAETDITGLGKVKRFLKQLTEEELAGVRYVQPMEKP